MTGEPCYYYEIKASNNSPSLTVYSENKDKIKLFMVQHGFKNFNDILICEDEYMLKFPSSILKFYQFKSNYNNESINLLTTDVICEQVILDIGRDVEESAYFMCDLITNIDIPIIKVINDLIFKLDDVYVVDFISDKELAKSDELSDYVKISRSTIKQNTNYTREELLLLLFESEPQLTPDSFVGSDFTCDELLLDFDEIKEFDVMPFTIEAYVQHFTAFLIGLSEEGELNHE